MSGFTNHFLGQPFWQCSITCWHNAIRTIATTWELVWPWVWLSHTPNDLNDIPSFSGVLNHVLKLLQPVNSSRLEGFICPMCTREICSSLGNVGDIILCLGEPIHNILLEQTLHCGISTHIMFFFGRVVRLTVASKIILLHYTSETHSCMLMKKE